MKDFQKIYTIVLFILGYITNVIAQQNMNTEQYIKMYKDIAVREMQKTGIPASITLAQGLLESGVGNSSLAKEGNNHFGIKCHQDWTGRTMLLDDDAPDECFRVYPTAEASFIDHSMFLTTKQRYASLFQLPRYDYQSWAKEQSTIRWLGSACYVQSTTGTVTAFYTWSSSSLLRTRLGHSWRRRQSYVAPRV